MFLENGWVIFCSNRLMYLISKHPAMLNAWPGFVLDNSVSKMDLSDLSTWNLTEDTASTDSNVFQHIKMSEMSTAQQVEGPFKSIQPSTVWCHVHSFSTHVANFGNVKHFDIPIIASYKQIGLIQNQLAIRLCPIDPRRTWWHAGKTSAGPRPWTFVFHLIHTHIVQFRRCEPLQFRTCYACHPSASLQSGICHGATTEPKEAKKTLVGSSLSCGCKFYPLVI